MNSIEDVLSGRATWAIECCDCLEGMCGLSAASTDLIVADPPYFKVKDLEWDHQWKTAEAYLAWVGELCVEWRRVMKPNGSLYVFASPQMATGLESAIASTFNVLNRITWRKEDGWAKRQCKEEQRAYFPASEAIIFAEQYGADGQADGASGYTAQCESVKVSVIGSYLRSEIRRAGATNRNIAELFPSANGGLTGCVSNWLLGYNMPTPQQYQAIRDFLNSINRTGDYLRREYEDLRRPFSVDSSVPYTDVWDFPTVQAAKGKHPCEKPTALMRHIVSTSSRPNALVLDPFAGSGVLGEVCKELDRRYIGMERDAKWCLRAANRIEEYAPLFMQPECKTAKTFSQAAGGLFDGLPEDAAP